MIDFYRINFKLISSIIDLELTSIEFFNKTNEMVLKVEFENRKNLVAKKSSKN